MSMLEGLAHTYESSLHADEAEGAFRGSHGAIRRRTRMGMVAALKAVDVYRDQGGRESAWDAWMTLRRLRTMIGEPPTRRERRIVWYLEGAISAVGASAVCDAPASRSNRDADAEAARMLAGIDLADLTAALPMAALRARGVTASVLAAIVTLPH